MEKTLSFSRVAAIFPANEVPATVKVCFLINQLAPDGAPTLLLDIVRQTQNQTDIDYTVLFLEGEDTLAPEFESEGARVVDFDATFKFDPVAIFRLARYLRREKFDILHTHLPYSQSLGRLFGFLGESDNLVSTQHNVPYERHPITRTLERVTRPLDNATIAVASDIEREYTNSVHLYDGQQDGQWCTIYNGIDVEGFHENVKNASPETFKAKKNIQGNPIFLTVGRYVPAKAQTDIIEAMSHVTEELPDAKLLLVGWGELEEELNDAVTTHAVEDSVTVVGRVPAEEIPEYFALGDVFVSSSLREGLPIAILEAMAANLPVVGTKIPGVKEVVKAEKTGLLVPPEDPHALAESMVQSVEMNHQYGQNGYERVRNHFNVRTTAQSYVNLYEELTQSE